MKNPSTALNNKMLQTPPINSVDFFNIEIKFYGIMIFFALLFGLGVTYFISKKYYPKIDRVFLLDLFPIMVIGGILGARIYYVLLSLKFYFVHPAEIIAIWHGGLAIHGAILGGLISAIIYCRNAKKPLLPYADVISYGLVIGQAIGRWGNFFNQEAFGAPTNLPWKLFIEAAHRPAQFLNNEFFHPTFLYESIADVIIFLFLFFVIKRLNKSGTVFFSYLILYSIVRFFIEGIRIDSVLNINSIPIAQIISVITIITGVLGLIFTLKAHGEKEKC